MPAYEDEERDEKGRWTGGSGGGGSYSAAELAGAIHPDGSAFSTSSVDPMLIPGIQDYQLGAALSINDALRTGVPLEEGSADKGAVAAMDYAIQEQEPTDAPAVLARAVGPNAPDYASMAEGTEFTDPGFVSTTATGPGLENVMREGGQLESEHLLEIHVPEGSQGLAMNSVLPDSSFAEQDEVVLPRGSTFQVIMQATGRTIVSLKP